MRTFVLCLLIPFAGYSQNSLHLTLFGGFAGYQGDLQSKNFTLDQSYGVFGAGLKYELTPNWAVKAGLYYGKVHGSDARNDPSLKPRNLSFETKLFEWNTMVEFTLFDMQEKKISPYVFAGLGMVHFNPYAYDSLGNKIYLKPLSTEGEGLSQYPDRKPYKLNQLVIPFGGGIKFRVSDNVVLGYEIGLRKMFTDYLDDVSTRYVDPFILAQQKGLRAVEMSYRGGELKNGNQNYPAEGTIRGGEKYKDWYYFHGFSLSVGINTGRNRSFGNSGRKGHRLDCPTRVL